jgi:hypothetical protein
MWFILRYAESALYAVHMPLWGVFVCKVAIGTCFISGGYWLLYKDDIKGIFKNNI